MAGRGAVDDEGGDELVDGSETIPSEKSDDEVGTSSPPRRPDGCREGSALASLGGVGGYAYGEDGWYDLAGTPVPTPWPLPPLPPLQLDPVVVVRLQVGV
jgi:hypothetical protein